MQQFIEYKSEQLSFYLRSFWQNKLPYSELECFLWDTFEEWSQVTNQRFQPYTHQERVFWYMLHQTQFWDESTLKSDSEIRGQLENCMLSLEGDAMCPLDVVGHRP